ncbi:hypothetical protein [Flavobacterium daemonense]|uniref:hypothetical protein n=1 Tax=Flavobacterium daemonense TaxID=1393049 RepID=UPI0011854FEF|nr:hypothetical protein [Flavobacterium daemonense]KAF2337217.1 hypothetical protein FND99_02050 [Flavobacterium daemonense]
MDILETREFWYFFIPLVVGTFVAFKIHYMSESTKEEKEHLLYLFKQNQILSKSTQEMLHKYIIDYNASNRIAFPDSDVTLGNYYELMTEEYNRKLSDERYNYIKSEKMSKTRLLSHLDSLSKQNEALLKIELDMKMLIKKSDNWFVM